MSRVIKVCSNSEINISYFLNCTVVDNKQVNPSSAVLWKGTSIILHCNSSVFTRWFFQNITSEPISHSKVLAVSQFQRKKEGNYICFGDYEDNGGYFISYALLKLSGYDAKC